MLRAQEPRLLWLDEGGATTAQRVGPEQGSWQRVVSLDGGEALVLGSEDAITVGVAARTVAARVSASGDLLWRRAFGPELRGVSDAIRQGDRVWFVVRGGEPPAVESWLGWVSPSGEAQLEALRLDRGDEARALIGMANGDMYVVGAGTQAPWLHAAPGSQPWSQRN